MVNYWSNQLSLSFSLSASSSSSLSFSLVIFTTWLCWYSLEIAPSLTSIYTQGNGKKDERRRELGIGDQEYTFFLLPKERNQGLDCKEVDFFPLLKEMRTIILSIYSMSFFFVGLGFWGFSSFFLLWTLARRQNFR